MRVLITRWSELSEEEQFRAVALAEELAQGLMQAEAHAYAADPRHEVEAARPASYAHWALLLSQGQPHHREFWKLAGNAELAADPRVCAFAAVWECERCQILGNPRPYGSPFMLTLDRALTRERWGQARRQHRLASETLARRAPLPQGDEARLQVGRCRVALIQAEDDYWRATMLDEAARYQARSRK